MSRFDLAVFDLDGTLIDSRADLAASVNRALAAQGLPGRPAEEVAGFIGEGARRLVERSAPAGSARESVDALLAAFLRDYGQHLLDATVLYPGIADLLAGPPAKKAVATNKPGELSRRILAGLGVGARFQMILGGDDVIARKPAPEAVQRILDATGVPASRAAFIGDSVIDLRTARAAGVAAVAVTWGLGRGLEEERPDFMCANAAELAALLGS